MALLVFLISVGLVLAIMALGAWLGSQWWPLLKAFCDVADSSAQGGL